LKLVLLPSESIKTYKGAPIRNKKWARLFYGATAQIKMNAQDVGDLVVIVNSCILAFLRQGASVKSGQSAWAEKCGGQFRRTANFKKALDNS
jgi:hypothetical protein